MYCKGIKDNGEACSKIATENGQYCKFHEEQNRVSSFFQNRDIIIKESWDSVIQEVRSKKSQSPLSQIIDYWEYKVSDAKVNVSRTYLVDWYVSNLGPEGHPVEIVQDSSKRHFYNRYSYISLLEEGFPKTDDEIVKEYLTKNPDAAGYEISEDTEIELYKIYQIAKDFELPISKQTDYDKRLLSELKKHPNVTEKEVMKSLRINKFELNKLTKRLDIKLAKEKTVASYHSDRDEIRIRKNCVYLYEKVMPNIRSLKLLTSKQEELLLVLFQKDGNIDAISNHYRTKNHRILERLTAISRNSSKLKDIIEKIRLGNHAFEVKAAHVSEVHEPSFNEIHDEYDHQVDEEISYEGDTPFLRAIDMAKVAKFVAFDYLRKYGYRALSSLEWVYLFRQEFPEIFNFYNNTYGKKHVDNLQFFRPQRPPKYSIDFIKEHYTKLSEEDINFDMPTQNFLFECLVTTKSQIYSDEAKKHFNPRIEGIYKEQFIICEGYIKEKIKFLSDDIAALSNGVTIPNSLKHFCNNCGYYGQASKFTIETSKGIVCIPCKQGDSFLRTRLLSLSQDNLTTKCPMCEISASGLKEIQEVFGFRKIQNKTIPQSWCRKCR